VENLKSLSDASKQTIELVASRLSAETGAAAVMLSGPHALGVDRQDDKIYLLAIIDGPDGVIEHRFADAYAGVERQMEIGIFPRRFVDKLAAEGYWDMVSLRAAEVLRIAVPLIDPTGYGKRSAEAMATYLPEKRFISGKIHGIKATFDDAVSLYSKSDYAGAVLVAREALRLAVELVLKQAPSAAGGVDETLRAGLGEEGYASLLEGLGIARATEEDLKRHLDALGDLGSRILKDLGIADDLAGR
jgi:hypothetical protein